MFEGYRVCSSQHVEPHVEPHVESHVESMDTPETRPPIPMVLWTVIVTSAWLTRCLTWLTGVEVAPVNQQPAVGVNRWHGLSSVNFPPPFSPLLRTTFGR